MEKVLVYITAAFVCLSPRMVKFRPTARQRGATQKSEVEKSFNLCFTFSLQQVATTAMVLQLGLFITSFKACIQNVVDSLLPKM
jgi:hypothetical protein